MKRRDSDPGLFKLLQMYDGFTRRNQLSLDDADTRSRFIAQVQSQLASHKANKARLHGLHKQSMFAHIAAAMDACMLISEEDAGEFFDAGEDLGRPDFRIVTRSGLQMLVEVKNHHKGNYAAPIVFKREYVEKLRRYASATACSLKFAVFWGKWRLWTLVDCSRLTWDGDTCRLSMLDAFDINEMHLLGDQMIGTVPPLTFEITCMLPNAGVARPSGKYLAKQTSQRLFAGGVQIQDPRELKLAWFFLRYGKWNLRSETFSPDLKGTVRALIEASPEEGNDNGEWATIGYLSSMISQQFSEFTSGDGKVNRLTPLADADELGVLIANDYKGSALRLWRFHILPKFDDVTKYLNATAN